MQFFSLGEPKKIIRSWESVQTLFDSVVEFYPDAVVLGHDSSITVLKPRVLNGTL